MSAIILLFTGRFKKKMSEKQNRLPDENRKIYIARFQKNLNTLRKIAGWSAEDLGRELDVTRQYISKIETGKSKMSVIQYIAFRTVFELEIQTNNKTGPIIAEALKVLVDEPIEENLSKSTAIETTTIGAATSSLGVTSAVIGAVGAVSALGGALGAGNWLTKISKFNASKNKAERFSDEQDGEENK
jgi:transcriptional regulator with XRE-family HTH domain